MGSPSPPSTNPPVPTIISDSAKTIVPSPPNSNPPEPSSVKVVGSSNVISPAPPKAKPPEPSRVNSEGASQAGSPSPPNSKPPEPTRLKVSGKPISPHHLSQNRLYLLHVKGSQKKLRLQQIRIMEYRLHNGRHSLPLQRIPLVSLASIFYLTILPQLRRMPLKRRNI